MDEGLFEWANGWMSGRADGGCMKRWLNGCVDEWICE